MGNNLIEYLDGNKFKTTEKGLNYLKCITKWQNCYKLLQLKMTINFYSNSIFVSI